MCNFVLFKTRLNFKHSYMKRNCISIVISAFWMLGLSVTASGQKTENIKFGDFDQWITRNIKESRIIGGKTRQVYEIGPTKTIDGDKAYVNQGGSPWATSNVMAKVCGITKTSNAVYPETREGANKCAKLTTVLEKCKAIGIINIDVVVAGTIFLGQMFEPIKSTSEPYKKMEMGVPFTKRPTALVYDYKLYIPDGNVRTYSSGFGSKKTLKGSDKAEVFIILQRRWEDADGNLYAKRVGTGHELLSKNTDDWVNDHKLKIIYGDASKSIASAGHGGLIAKDKSYCARNSKGENVPVVEVGWDDENATPTHLMIMFSAGSGEPYVGTIGTDFRIDNVGLLY